MMLACVVGVVIVDGDEVEYVSAIVWMVKVVWVEEDEWQKNQVKKLDLRDLSSNTIKYEQNVQFIHYPTKGLYTKRMSYANQELEICD